MFQNLFDFLRDFDHIFNRFLTGGWQGGLDQQRGVTQMATFAPAIDAFVDRDGKRFNNAERDSESPPFVIHSPT